MTSAPLISPEELLARLVDPAIRIADVRWSLAQPGKGRRDYDEAHLPGAVFVDLDADLAAPRGPGRHPLPDPAVFAARMGELGFGDEHEVVAYDDAGGTIAARLWWMLDNLGHRLARLLDGGIQAWLAIGGPTTFEVPAFATARLRLDERWSRVVERDELRSRLGEITLIDARAAERYRGDVEPVDPAAGHTPTARSLPAGRLLAEDARFASPDVLRSQLAGAGAADGRQVVTSCGSGVTACHTALAMRVAGLPDPLLYPGSFSDWSRSGLPVVTGDEPGDA